MERETGIVEKRVLLEKLEKDYGIGRVEAERLLGQLIRDGTIYEPREGFTMKIKKFFISFVITHVILTMKLTANYVRCFQTVAISSIVAISVAHARKEYKSIL